MTSPITFLHSKSLRNRRANSFLLEKTLFQKEGKNKLTVPSQESVSVYSVYAAEYFRAV